MINFAYSYLSTLFCRGNKPVRINYSRRLSCISAMLRQPVKKIDSSIIREKVNEKIILHSFILGDKKRQIIEKVRLNNSSKLSPEFKYYCSDFPKKGKEWKSPNVIGLVFDEDYFSIFIEYVAMGGEFRKIRHSLDDYCQAAYCLGRMNANLFSAQNDFKKGGSFVLKKDPQLDLLEEKIRSFREIVISENLISMGEQDNLFYSLRRFEAAFKGSRYLFDSLPVTFCHGDANRGNLFLANDAYEIMLIDWERVRLANFGYDLAQLLYSTFWGSMSYGSIRDGSLMEEFQPAVLQSYHRGVGRSDISLEVCRLGLDLRVIYFQLLTKFPVALAKWHAAEKKIISDKQRLEQIRINWLVMKRKLDAVSVTINSIG
ncbi:aminoglycoside phosphotransferase family protein [Halomonas sp. KM-1]|uniref:aminoglycoside phosphotransferase family protein n=1 Tax=Halomonas sp. KM-1 TaxID=590061 RepID=UPI00193090FC|nr:aminoglycoside phosphotransferase family protein [Halomonas sp. KM-1]